MVTTGWMFVVIGCVFVGFAVYHYVRLRVRATPAPPPGATGHRLKWVGSLLVGSLLITCGIVMLTSGT